MGFKPRAADATPGKGRIRAGSRLLRRGIAPVAFGALLLSACAGTAWALLPSAPDLPRFAEGIAAGEPLRIVAFGSSSTQGVGASSPAAAYPARLQEVLRRALPDGAGDVTVLNKGIGGEAIDEMLGRLDRDVIASKPHLVIWQTGSNDPLRGVSLEHFREGTVSAIRRIREAGIDVVLMEPQWCPKLDGVDGAYRFRDAVREIGEAEDVPVIRRFELMREWLADARVTQADLLAPDGLHMRDAGYSLLAEAAAEEILKDAVP
jgi:acyl-CoA thioesterase-1